MEDNQSQLIFNFIGKNSIFKEYKVLGNIYNFDATKIKIPNNFFGPKKEKKIIEFKLIFKNEIINNELCFYLYVYFGINKVYCFLEKNNGLLYDICFLDNKIVSLNRGELELKEFNNLENDSRTRIVLINSPSKFKINNIDLKLNLYIPIHLHKLNKSFQLSFFDFFQDAYSVKAINLNELDEELLIVKTLKENKNALINFFNELKLLIKSNESDQEQFQKLCEKISLETKIINFSQKKEILEKNFDNEELYYLIYIYMLWLIYNSFFSSNDKNNEIDNDYDNNDSDEAECNYSIVEVFEYITKFYEKYENDKELVNYQKVLLFCSNVIYFIKINDINAYNDSQLEYIKYKNIEKNSIFGFSFQFLNDFIDNLNNKSEIFYPLLLLDNGLYYYNNNPTYGFDFQNCDNIKEHLKDLIPDVFFVFKKKFLLQEEKGFTFKGFKIIFLNKYVILNNYNGNPIKNDKNTKVVKHYATRVSKFFMHETFGHIKFIYQHRIGPSSPRYFFNKNKKLITMVPKNEINKNKDYFIINQRYDGGESGNFLDYFFGTYEDELVLNLIYLTKDIGKLIDNVKYFTKENLDILRKYIIYKYTLSEKGIEYATKENTSLEEDVNEMNQIIQLKGIKLAKNTNLKRLKISEIKKDQHTGILFLNSEIKNYSYYVKKINESKSNRESGKFLKKLIFNHLKLE